jgi:MFS family permease
VTQEVLQGEELIRMGLVEADGESRAQRVSVRADLGTGGDPTHRLPDHLRRTLAPPDATKQYGIAQAVSSLVLVVVGAAGVVGVLAGGTLGDFLLHRGYLNGRILVSAIAAALAVVFFLPAIFTRSPLTALPYISLAVLALAAQNPSLDAARLDIMPPLLWGRAEGVRTFLRTVAQAFAPLLFGAVSDHVFGGGRSGLQWTFAIMLLPLAASAYFLFKALRTYPRDVATATAMPTRPDISSAPPS